MTSRPPLGTLCITNVGELGPNSVIGIDTQFFTVQHFLKGVKLIPPGHHLLHFSESVEEGVSMRYSWWFLITEGDVLTVNWAGERADFAFYDHSKGDIGDIYQHMVSYPENPEKWTALSQYIDSEALEEYLPPLYQAITTSTPSAEENMVLLDLLRSKKSDIDVSDQSQDELKYTIIEPHKRRPEVVGEQLTQDLLDRSWYLSKLFDHDIELLLAELQLSFIHFIVLCNLCSMTQWMSLLSLVSNSKSYLELHEKVCSDLLDLLKVQFEVLPEDYVLENSVTQVIDTDAMEAILTKMNDVFFGYSPWHKILKIAQIKFRLNVAPTKTLDEHQFEIYDISNHDQEDEDAPVIVF